MMLMLKSLNRDLGCFFSHCLPIGSPKESSGSLTFTQELSEIWAVGGSVI